LLRRTRRRFAAASAYFPGSVIAIIMWHEHQI
jgi:hypothetical protein